MFIWTIQDIMGLVLLAGVALYFIGMLGYYMFTELCLKIKKWTSFRGL